MDATPFTFALDCSSRSNVAGLLRDLATQVLGYAGCAPDTIASTVDALVAAVAEAPGGPPLGLTFHSDIARLDIVVSCDGREVYRASRAIG